MFDFSDWEIRDINKRLDEISLAVETRSGDTSALLAEVEALNARKRECVAKYERREQAKAAILAGHGTVIPKPGDKPYRAQEQQRSGRTLTDMEDMEFTDLEGNPIRRAGAASRVVFRSGDKITDKYPESKNIDFDKCMRAALSGDYSKLNTIERAAIVPSAGGAIMNPQMSSILLDDTRQSDWMEILQPTVVTMDTEELKIPVIVKIPDAVMHKPGVCEDFSEPAIDAVWLRAKTMIVLCECTNELLNDSPLAEGLILRTMRTAISNKLLEQYLYGEGDGSRAEVNPEMQGVATYPPANFADYEDASDESDLFKLATNADIAIRMNNGQMNALLYDPHLEHRLEERTSFGTVMEPSRAFSRLYNAGRAIPHVSVKNGDMLYFDSREVYIGARSSIEILIDKLTTLNCYTTRFRLVFRGDIWYNTKHMAYYPNIPLTGEGVPTP